MLKEFLRLEGMLSICFQPFSLIMLINVMLVKKNVYTLFIVMKFQYAVGPPDHRWRGTATAQNINKIKVVFF